MLGLEIRRSWHALDCRSIFGDLHIITGIYDHRDETR